MTSRTLAVCGLVAALLVAVWHLPGVVRRLDNGIAVGHARAGLDRQLPAARQLGIDPGALLAARRAMPRDAVYLVATPKGASDLASLAFPNLAANELLPRRRTLEPAEAGWVLAFRVDPRTLGLRVGRVESLGPDVALARVSP